MNGVEVDAAKSTEKPNRVNPLASVQRVFHCANCELNPSLSALVHRGGLRCVLNSGDIKRVSFA